VTADLVRAVAGEELERIRAALGGEAFDAGRWKEAAVLFDQTALGERFVEFLTLPAYERLG
jgi:malate synthase